MPKQKTHSGTKKRFRVTGGGKVVYKKVGRGHLLRKKNGKRLRRLRELGVLDTAQAKNVKEMLPYA
jgi:large subunit ribosomal protein L35